MFLALYNQTFFAPTPPVETSPKTYHQLSRQKKIFGAHTCSFPSGNGASIDPLGNHLITDNVPTDKTSQDKTVQ